MTNISRRQLLGSAVAAAAAAPAAMAAPSNPCELPVTWEEEHELIVVGSGGAGLAVAVSARQNGLKDVVVLEKMAFVGGNTSICGGAFNSSDSKRQLEQGIKDSPEFHAEQTLKGGDGRGNPDLVRKMTANSEAALNWLESLGVQFKPKVYQIYGALYPRSHDSIHSKGADYIEVLKGQCEKLGIRIYTRSHVDRVVREKPLAGKVEGVVFTGEDGKSHAWKASKAVAVCAGGFAGNPKMRARYDPRLLNLTTTNLPGVSTGDMIAPCCDIGADTTGMDFIQCNPGCPPGRKQRVMLHGHVERYIMVDRQAKRFVAEDERRDVIRDAVLALPDQTAFSIIDGDGYAILNDSRVAAVKKGLESGDAWMADSIEELAQKMGVDPKSLRETIDEFNAGVDKGVDPIGKNKRNLNKIAKAPFVAAYAGMAAHHTMGGLRINTDCQVLDRYDEVIPNLYAVGEVAGGIHGTNRLGGNAVCDIFTFGRLTGIYIATH